MTGAVAAAAMGLMLGMVPSAASADPLQLPPRTMPYGMFAPVDQTGPALTVPAARLAAGMQCHGITATSPHKPVLFVPGTGASPADYEWNWGRALRQAQRPYCMLALPNKSVDNIDISAQYTVFAVRTLHARTGKKVDIIGHSQGGLSPRFALRFWPGIRPLVDDVVSLATPNHGSFASNGSCIAPCKPAVRQMMINSALVQAVNSWQETFAGVSYTQVFTTFDELVLPSAVGNNSSSLTTGNGQRTNVAVQQICSGDTSEHMMVGTTDPVAYRLGIDAVDHPGPANPARIARSVCGEQYMPGVDPATATGNLAGSFGGAVVASFTPTGMVTVEPALPGYTLAPRR
jgi:pimeloyl-ACP methyl ester carboxylesterase